MASEEHVALLKQGTVVWKQWRVDNPSTRPDLSGANLRRADLTGADLSNVNLAGANLTGAHLTESDLTGADLSNADLYQADLRKADLRRANLTGAYLTGADLSNADLTGTELREVDLHEANVSHVEPYRTIFANVNLSTVKGLETVQHRGPSTIGIDTLVASQGKIPAAFLRGAGVPEMLIDYLPSLFTQPLQFYSCFISYSHADKVFAQRLHDTLQGRGIRCWLDEHQLLPGDDIYDMMDWGIRLWDKFLLCGSQASLSPPTNWWVDKEITIALAKEQQLLQERGEKVLTLIPLNLDNYMLTKWQDGKAEEVRRRLAADFTGWERDTQKFEQQVERVIRALQLDGREQPPTPRL